VKLLAALLVVPLTSGMGWQVLAYRGIPPHDVRFSASGLRIDVRKSAAPLIYPLGQPVAVTTVRARGRISGTLNVPPDRQGESGFDDYAFRLGLVEVGERRLGFMERRLAPAWVRKLFSLAPPGMGVSRIRFFNVGVEPGQIGRRREHPLSELILEQVVTVPDREGRFELFVRLESAIETAAIWISTDGDDTRSTYTVTIERIELNGPEGGPSGGFTFDASGARAWTSRGVDPRGSTQRRTCLAYTAPAGVGPDSTRAERRP